MCGGGGGYSQKDAKKDREAARKEAEEQRLAAEAQAQASANAATAAKRTRMRGSTLMTRGAGRLSSASNGATPTALTQTVMARGVSTLGGT